MTGMVLSLCFGAGFVGDKLTTASPTEPDFNTERFIISAPQRIDGPSSYLFGDKKYACVLVDKATGYEYIYINDNGSIAVTRLEGTIRHPAEKKQETKNQDEKEQENKNTNEENKDNK